MDLNAMIGDDHQILKVFVRASTLYRVATNDRREASSEALKVIAL